MPIYEFECPICHTRVQETRKMAQSSDPGPACPKHRKTPTKRVMSRFMAYVPGGTR